MSGSRTRVDPEDDYCTAWLWYCDHCRDGHGGYLTEDEAMAAADDHDQQHEPAEPDPDLAVDIWKEERA
ncbi:hypothetical protein [Nocardioides alcanivorans]|uniref:hypothetical protein n=1 Tax=Nocardioides alcanivorans TaxID=2897352 RepID=UPI001F36B2BC|nr:hypothetical protein [Nocardioides alcanivorans]